MQPRFRLERLPLRPLLAVGGQRRAIDGQYLATGDEMRRDAVPLGARHRLNEFGRAVTRKREMLRFNMIQAPLAGIAAQYLSAPSVAA